MNWVLRTCRASAVEAWEAQGPQAAANPPQPLDLGTLFRPAALLSALEQQACRAAGVALGQLQLASCWPGAGLGHAGQAGRFQVQVAGLLLQGTLFDGYCLTPVQQVSVRACVRVSDWMRLIIGMLVSLPCYAAVESIRSATSAGHADNEEGSAGAQVTGNDHACVTRGLPIARAADNGWLSLHACRLHWRIVSVHNDNLHA